MSDSGWSIEQKGFDHIQVNFRGLNDLSAFDGAMREALLVLKQEASVFPPQPDRMRSGHFNTWVREQGQWSIGHFRTVAGRARKKFAGGRLLRVSEKLLAHWKQAEPVIYVGAGQIIGRLENKTTYGGWVQGEQQTRWHAQTGWQTTAQIEQKNEARIKGVFEAALQKLVSKLGG